MITTIVLVQADPKGIPVCATALTAIEGVAEVYSVSGAWDVQQGRSRTGVGHRRRVIGGCSS
ncbi:MAG: hypothetical protein EBV77_05295 [Gemmatimonadaceae bacterium]|nr:hypothetical protein [Gemmatimonadaceae bacterium]